MFLKEKIICLIDYRLEDIKDDVLYEIKCSDRFSADGIERF